MLLNTWLSAARRHFAQGTSTRRVARSAARNSGTLESLEARTLLTALVINPDTRASYLNANGGIEVTTADMAGKDSLVIEGFTIAATSGDAISINLSGITLRSLAIETMTVSQYTSLGIDIDLTNVTGLNTIAIEDIRMTGTRRGLDLRLSNTDAKAVTIDDSIIPGIKVAAVSGSDIEAGLITGSRIIAGSGIEGILLDVNAGTADNFQIENNLEVSSPNRDFIRVNSTNAPLDGLTIKNNSIGTQLTQGVGLSFRAEGDTFVQSMVLRNDSTNNEWLQTFVLDLDSIGLEFDQSTTTGKPFTASAADRTATGLVSSVVSADRKTLTLTFNNFAPGESLPFVIDIDRAVRQPAAIFGDDLIGADVSSVFQNQSRTATRSVAGQMIGDPNKLTASEFAVGPNVAGTTQGIALNLNNSPTTNLLIVDNTVTGAPGHALLIAAANHSDVTGVISDNQLDGAGRDGIRLDMVDSNFTGAVIDNSLQGNGGHGIAVMPTVTRKGLVEAALDLNPVVITSTNHGLVTGDQIMLQGLVNDDPTVNHPGNGLHTITRIDNNRFRLNGVSGTSAGVRYVGGGTWYVPEIQSDGSARGLVTVDMQTTIPQGTIRAATNASQIVITSPSHGLTSGQRVRVSNVSGNTAANGVHKITVLDANRFRLDGIAGNGTYTTAQGFGSWTANVITAAANSSNLVLTSPGHGLQTGEEIRVTGVLGNTAANGTFKVTVVDANSFRLIGAAGNGTYGGGGNWVRLNDKTSTGDLMPQRIGGNLINSNKMAGIMVNLDTGTIFNGDIVSNTLTGNEEVGIHVISHSFGLGSDLPLNPAQPFALPGAQDISFNVNIGTSAAGDGNTLKSNSRAGIAIEALDQGTGSFEIRNNSISNSVNDGDTSTNGDGILVRLQNDVSPTEAVSFLAESIIDGNDIGVDDGGNQGNGLLFTMQQRTRIQDLQLTNTVFLNNRLDGFHFETSESAYVNSLVIEKNRSANNVGDGIDLFGKNSNGQRQDFRINENVMQANGQYGMRVSAEADVTFDIQFDRNTVIENGHARTGGFHPNDNTGTTNFAGGVGISAFQQIDVSLSMTDTKIDRNIGDGLSIDAFRFFDSLIANVTVVNSTLNNNTLVGFRNHGAAFGKFDFRGSEFNENGDDGFRSVSIEDKSDVYRRRVGGMDIDVVALDNEFNQNGGDGVQLGQGVSADFGDGSIANANYFLGNTNDGLKITQHNSPYMDDIGRRRQIQADRNFFQSNQGNGIDIGHDASQETGNVEHGDEVASDVHVTINNAVISGNTSDGVEYLADDQLRIGRVVGGGQDVIYDAVASLAVSNSRITNNGGRGVDVLNRGYEDSRVALINNDILSNRMEGIYVVNTASYDQLQFGSSDPLTYADAPFSGSDAAFRTPNIELRVQDNLIESNGNSTLTSTVPVQQSEDPNDRSATPDADWTHNSTQISGTLGGLVIRVGTVDSIGVQRSAVAGFELGRSGVSAEVWRNSFDGNFGADVYFDNFTSSMVRLSRDNFSTAQTPNFRWLDGYRDPLSRFNLSFRENAGNSLDVLNGFAYYDNWESLFKSRDVQQSTAPNAAINPLPPAGHFNNPGRRRNATRTIGRADNAMGDAPGSYDFGFVDWSYDGTGTSTWRVESDFDFGNFSQTSPTLGFSSFFTEVSLGNEPGERWDYQWDTGINTPTFTGLTPYSLQRGDIFNVRAGEAPISADELEGNNSFASAHNLGTVSGAGYSVNAQTLSGNLNMHLKGDRDYYRFTAAGTGAMVLNLNALDALGDNLSYLIYRVDSTRQTEEVPMFTNPDGSPSYFTAVAGGSRAISTNVVAGQEYIIEILSDEGSNNAYDAGFDAFGKSFVYGTSRSYSLTLNAPAGPLSAPSTTTTGSGGATSGSSVTINPGVVQGSSTAIVAAANVPGAAPTAKFVAVSPDPRSTSAGTVTLNFTEDVTGVGISDFRLTRNGVNIPLSSSLLRRVNAAQYTINLSTLTGEAGTYKISLVASGSGIADTDSVLLTSSASDTWVVSNTVTTGSDTPDVNVGDGIARDSNGAVSLRAAIMEANATPGSDVILLGSRTHTLSRDGRYEDLAFTGDLDILGDLTIRGVSATTTIINANDLDRVFHIASGRTLTLENLTITGGEAFDGGAIFNSGTLILNNVNIRANEAYNQGGGIYNAGTGRITATGSSISQNLAGSRGGAVHNMGTGTYVSTTFSTNVAVSRGGGLFNEGSSARSTLLNVTMANNVTGSRGGGLYSESSASTTIGNSILQANLTDGRVPSTNATIGKDMFGGVVSRGNNIIQTLDRRFTSATTAGLLTSDRFGRDATPLASALNSLTYSTGNGVGVHTLRATGIAVDAGNNSLYPTTPLVNQLDAIGNPRLIEGNKDGVVTIDVGAVELLVNIPVAIFTATPNPAGLNQVITLTGTGSTHSNPASGRIVRWQWDFDYSSSAGFRPDAEGATTTHSYTDASRSSYVVRLLVTDNFGNTGFFDRTITVGKPTKPVVQRPFSVTTDRTPLIRWTASPATYRVQVVRVTSSGRTTVVNQSNLTSTSYNVTTSLSDGNYEVIVTATNGSGSTASSAWKFSVVAVTPTSPMVRTFDVTPLFTWGAVPGTSRYEIWIRQTAPVYVDTVFRSSTLSTPSYEATTSLGLGTFDWTVRAYDADGVAGNWFKTQTFKTERPTLSRPLSVTVDTTPTFTWNDMDAKPAGQKDTRYELWVNQIGGRAKIIHQTSLTSTSYTPTTALPNGSFEAWVRAIAPDGEAGLWSSVRRFTMDYRIGPVVSAPTGTVTDRTPTFRWQAADGARSYDLWVNNLTTGKSQVIRVIVPHVANASTISYTPAAELLSGDYRWWVRTIAVSGDQTAWSSGLNFTIPRPAITAPLGAITTDLPRFTWTGVSQYVSYELWVNNLTTGTQKIIYEKGLTTTSYQTVLPLENGSFRAYVRGVDAAGNFSEWSPQGNFTVTVGVGTAPTILSPRNSVFTAGSRPTFFWNAGTVGSSYEILVKRISDSSQPIVINQRGIQGTSFTTTTGLSAGTYRWWVRALDSTGNGLPWSQPAIFQVVSNDVNESAPVDLPNADSALMAVLTVQAENWSPDAVRSISVHPAEMVMQVEPSAAVAESFVRVQQTPIASTEEVADIDNFMEDFAESALFLSADDVMTPGVALNDSVAPVQNSVATSNVSVSEDDHHTLNLVMAGLVAGSVISTRKRSDDDQN